MNKVILLWVIFCFCLTIFFIIAYGIAPWLQKNYSFSLKKGLRKKCLHQKQGVNIWAITSKETDLVIVRCIDCEYAESYKVENLLKWMAWQKFYRTFPLAHREDHIYCKIDPSEED